MFKTSRWKSDKNKINAVFKLQFHVTQVLEFGGNGLVLSLVPAENGKPTAKLEKFEMRENCCYWVNPVYETVKFIQDPKSGKIHERIYYFIISTGSPKGSLVGEFSVNIADYLAATKGCSVSFPFKNPNSKSHLHVSIQRIQENSTQRNLEENEGQKITHEERTLRQHFSNGDVEEGAKTNTVEDEPLTKTVSHFPGLNGIHRGSSGSDITLSSSDSSSGLDTPRELGVRNNNTNRDQTANGSSYQDQEKTRWDLAIVPVNGLNTDISMNSPRYVFSSDISQMGVDDSVEKLKADLVAFSRRAELSELELQTLRKQIVKESKKGHDLLKEITCLKEEKDALKDECEKLKALKVKSKSQSEGDPWILIEEIREELNYEKDLNTNLRLQLQKTQESNSELIFAVQDLEKMFEKNNSDEIILKCQSDDDDDDDEEQKALEELVRQHSGAQETYLLEQKIMDLCSEIEMYRRDKDELEMQMEQLALDYEILKQENHEFSSRLEQSHLQEQLKMQYESSSSYAAIIELEAQREKLQNELKDQSRQLSYCLDTMKELEASNQSLEGEMEKQVKRSKADKEALSRSFTTIHELEAEIKKLKMEVKKQLEDFSGCLATINELETHNHNLEEKLEKQAHGYRADKEALSRSSTTIKELETEIHKLKMELKKQLEDFSGCLTAINELETHNHNLEEKLEKQAQVFKADMEAVVHAKIEAENALACSNVTVNELDTRIKKLENELKTHSEDSSDTMAKLKELEAHIWDLEEELEKQVEGFEADLEAVTHAKVEQEQRAIRAEESLRLMRLKNVKTAARIQHEFKRLSTQMQSSFEANEKLTSKAVTEASELRLHNRHLQDILQKANDELQSAKDHYETKMEELNGQINMKSSEINRFEDKRKQVDELQDSASVQNSELRAEIQRLTSENKLLAEQMKALVPGENTEIDNLDGGIAMNLQSEVETLRAQCGNLKHSLYEDELEKEKLRKQVFQLNADLKKKDETITSIEKKFKDKSTMDTSKTTKFEPVQHGPKEVGAKDVATMKERIKLLEGEIKSKEASLETTANAFLVKERHLHGKIEELEIRLGECRQSSPRTTHDKAEVKVSVGMQVDCISEEVTSATGDMPEASITVGNLNDMDLKNSDEQTLPDTQPNASNKDLGEQQKFDILLREMVLLKERNNSMETELKEMQERYSEISLNFAEVEGERQKLVMRLRNLKITKKS